MTTTELAWSAGLFEGEGTIYKNKQKDRTYRMEMSMTDKDVIDRFHQAVGFGSVSEVDRGKSGKEHWKPLYRWYSGKREDIRQLLSQMLPYFGNRRAYTALNALDNIELD